MENIKKKFVFSIIIPILLVFLSAEILIIYFFSPDLLNQQLPTFLTLLTLVTILLALIVYYIFSRKFITPLKKVYNLLKERDEGKKTYPEKIENDDYGISHVIN